jgi:type IV pilus assembly protein PilX
MKQAQTSARAGMRRHRSPPRSERGMVVFIALIVLVAMTLAGLATLRSSGSAILTAGNLGFRQGATVAGDLAGEVGLAWLKTQGSVTLQTRDPTKGYYANFNDLQPPLPAGVTFNPMTWGEANWKNAAQAVQVNAGAVDAAGNRVSYVIHRMCAENGLIAGTGVSLTQECVTLSDPGKGAPKESGQKALVGTSQVYYRITARIEGPKNTVSFVQTMTY